MIDIFVKEMEMTGCLGMWSLLNWYEIMFRMIIMKRPCLYVYAYVIIGTNTCTYVDHIVAVMPQPGT